LGLCATVAANATDIMVLLFAADYADGGPVLAILVFAQGLFMTMLLTLCNVLFGGGRPAVAAILALSLVPVQVVLTALLVLRLGAPGAALGTLLGAGLGAALAVALVWRVIGPVFEWRVVAGTALAAALVAVGSRLFQSEGWILLAELTAAGLAYLLLLLLLRVIRLDDAQILFPARAAAGS
jgi:peptidoglycan biosynthesis protein MviN/MurJ (putative lipid II flippase)